MANVYKARKKEETAPRGVPPKAGVAAPKKADNWVDTQELPAIKPEQLAAPAAKDAPAKVHHRKKPAQPDKPAPKKQAVPKSKAKPAPKEKPAGRDAAKEKAAPAKKPAAKRTYTPQPQKKAEKALPKEPLPKVEAPHIGLLPERSRSLSPMGQLMRWIGGGLYMLGFSAEYRVVQGWRIFKNMADFFGSIMLMMGKALWGGLRTVFIGLAEEITVPYTRWKQERQQLEDAADSPAALESDGAESTPGLLGIRVKGSMKLVGGIAGIFMPIIAAVIFAVTVYSLVSMEYALAVEINGKVLGYVTDQNVVEGAKALLRDRIKLAGNQEIKDWQLTPTYSISRAPNYTTTTQLANEILLSGSSEPGDIVPATGVYLDNQLFAVTDDGPRLQAFLNNLLDDYRSKAPDGAEVAFVQDVLCNPESDEIFFASSVQDCDALIRQMSGNISDALIISADGVMTVGEIALANDLPVDVLMARNPVLAGLDTDDAPEEGTDILLQRAQPFLQVETVIREQYQETIPCTVQEVENPEKPKGVRVTVQEGVDGQQEVWDNVYYVDGEIDRRERVDDMTVVLVSPVVKIVEIGTKEPQSIPGRGGSGFIFPVPDSPYSSRGYVPGYHRGLDINAPAGTPIYACANGTVIAAGWHYSFGNYVVIQHAGGIQTLYAHCSVLYASAGQQVEQGTCIGLVGSTGNSSGNHCHLEVTVNGQLVDPVPFVGYPY